MAIVDQTAPVASITAIDSPMTNAGTVHYMLTFSEPVAGVDVSQFSLAGSGVSGASIGGVTEVSGSNGTQYMVSVNTGTGDGSVALEFTGAHVADLAGNGLPGGALQDFATFTGIEGYGIASEDLNEDGKQDLVAISSSNTVAVLLGDGDGSFQPPVSYTVENGIHGTMGLVIGDVNGDGNLDLAASAYAGNGTICTLLGNGDGTFQPQIVSQTDSTYPNFSAIADFNADGKPDLAVANTANRSGVSILIGNGDGTFAPSTVLSSDGDPIIIAAADLNGDHLPDIAFANEAWHANDVQIYLNNGDGTFGEAAKVQASGNVSSVTIEDLDSDGKSDLIFTNVEAGTVSVAQGNGDGTFGSAVSYAVGSVPDGSTTKDLNGDGKLDLLVTNGGSNTLSVLYGNGDTTFQPQIQIATGSGPVGLTVADFNGDGRPDVGVQNSGSHSVSLLLNNPPTIVASPYTIDKSGPTGWRFSLANSNFDGTNAIAAGTVLGTVTAVGDPNSTAFKYFFAADSSGSGAVQTMNGLTIDADTGVVTTAAAISLSSSPWLIVQDAAGNSFAQPFSINSGTPAGNTIAVPSGTTVTFGLGGNDTVTGTSVADAISGGVGNDKIIGFVGADVINGGAGTDTIQLTATSTDLNSAADGQVTNVEAISAAAAAVGVSIDLHSQAEGFAITGSSSADIITGGAGSDTINAGNGDDTIIGFAGTDTVNGGAGTDTIQLDADLSTATNAQITNVEAVSAAAAATGVSIDLHNQTEGFILTGSALADIIAGGTGNDTIVGGAGDDTIVGLAGSDNLDGGTGIDTIQITATSAALNGATDARIVNIEAVSAAAATSAVTIDLHNQSEGFAVSGGSGNDALTGGLGADAIAGGGGNDKIIGFIGADVINGGAGTDTVQLTATSTDLNSASDAQITNVEAISAATAAAGVTVDLHSQTEGFTISGSASADTIRGGTGADTISAGNGDDTIIGFSGTDAVNGGAGTDTLQLDSDLIGTTNAQISGVEAVSAVTAATGVTVDLHNQTEALTITGSGFADIITGGTGNDTIVGGAGDDTIVGFAGSDNLDGGTGIDTIRLTATSTALNGATDTRIIDIETVSAAAATNAVTINLHNQSEGVAIIGGSGNDALTGGLGADVFTGGTGPDTFFFTNLNEMGNSASTRDQITDFVSANISTGANDVIDLSLIDANINKNGNQAFTWDGQETSGNVGQGHLGYHYEMIDGVEHTIIDGNTNNATVSHNFQIDLLGHLNLQSGDFVL